MLLVNTARNSFVSLDRADGDAAYTGYNRREGFAWASSYPIAEGHLRAPLGGRRAHLERERARPISPPFASGYTLRPITELEDGSLLLPCYDESQVPCPSFVVPSYDQGRTWTGASLIALDDRIGFYEPAPAGRLPGGRVLAQLRTHQEGNIHLYQCHSDDGGRSWSRAQPTPMRGLPPHMLRLPGWTPAVRLRPSALRLLGFAPVLATTTVPAGTSTTSLSCETTFPTATWAIRPRRSAPNGSICTAYLRGQDDEGASPVFRPVRTGSRTERGGV